MDLLLSFLLLSPLSASAGAQPAPSLAVRSLGEDPSGCETFAGTLRPRNGKTVSFTQYCFRPQLSPDHRYVAIRQHGKGYGLFLIDAEDGSIQRHVLLQDKGEPEIGNFVWSPDSRYVAFTVCNQEAYPKRAKVFIDTVAQNKHQSLDASSILGVGAGCYVYDPVWSPDSEKFAIVENHFYERYWVSVYSPAGQKLACADLPQEVRDDRSKPYEQAAVYNGVESVAWDGGRLRATLRGGKRLELEPVASEADGKARLIRFHERFRYPSRDAAPHDASLRPGHPWRCQRMSAGTAKDDEIIVTITRDPADPGGYLIASDKDGPPRKAAVTPQGIIARFRSGGERFAWVWKNMLSAEGIAFELAGSKKDPALPPGIDPGLRVYAGGTCEPIRDAAEAREIEETNQAFERLKAMPRPRAEKKSTP